MNMNKRNLFSVGILDRFFFSIRFYSSVGNLRYLENWLPRIRKLGGRRFALDVLWLGFIVEDYEN